MGEETVINHKWPQQRAQAPPRRQVCVLCNQFDNFPTSGLKFESSGALDVGRNNVALKFISKVYKKLPKEVVADKQDGAIFQGKRVLA